MTQALGDDLKSGMSKSIPARRFGKPEEIAATIVFLASDEASGITGSQIVVDAGLTAGFDFRTGEEGA